MFFLPGSITSSTSLILIKSADFLPRITHIFHSEQPKKELPRCDVTDHRCIKWGRQGTVLCLPRLLLILRLIDQLSQSPVQAVRFDRLGEMSIHS